MELETIDYNFENIDTKKTNLELHILLNSISTCFPLEYTKSDIEKFKYWSKIQILKGNFYQNLENYYDQNFDEPIFWYPSFLIYTFKNLTDSSISDIQNFDLLNKYLR